MLKNHFQHLKNLRSSFNNLTKIKFSLQRRSVQPPLPRISPRESSDRRKNSWRAKASSRTHIRLIPRRESHRIPNHRQRDLYIALRKRPWSETARNFPRRENRRVYQRKTSAHRATGWWQVVHADSPEDGRYTFNGGKVEIVVLTLGRYHLIILYKNWVFQFHMSSPCMCVSTFGFVVRSSVVYFSSVICAVAKTKVRSGQRPFCPLFTGSSLSLMFVKSRDRTMNS